MSDLKSDADLLHLALTHEGDEFAARVVNDLQTQLAAMTAERDSLLSDWNAIVKASGSKTNGGAVGHVAALVRERDAERAKVAVLSDLVNHPMLREMLGKIEDSNTPESDLLWTYAMGWLDATRNALEKTR